MQQCRRNTRSLRNFQDSPRKTVHEQYLSILQLIIVLPSVSVYTMMILSRPTQTSLNISEFHTSQTKSSDKGKKYNLYKTHQNHTKIEINHNQCCQLRTGMGNVGTGGSHSSPKLRFNKALSAKTLVNLHCNFIFHHIASASSGSFS